MPKAFSVSSLIKMIQAFANNNVLVLGYQLWALGFLECPFPHCPPGRFLAVQ